MGTLVGLLALAVIVTWATRDPRDLHRAVLEHLASVTRQQLPLGPALQALAQERRESGRWWRAWYERTEADLLLGLAERVEASGSLAAALEGAPRHFSRELCAEVARAERTGSLADLLALRREEAQRADEARLDLQVGLTYPGLLLALVLGIGLFLELIVYPKFTSIAESMRFEWQGGWDPALPELVLIGCALVLAARLLSSRPMLSLGRGLAARLPLIGSPLRRRQHAAWMARVAGLLRTGATLSEGLDAAAEAAGPGRRALLAARDLARTGAPVELVLERALGRDAPALLPELVFHTRSEGGRAGGLEAALSRGAARQAERGARGVQVAWQALRPVPVFVCGLVVALHAWSAWGFITTIEAHCVASVEEAW